MLRLKLQEHPTTKLEISPLMMVKEGHNFDSHTVQQLLLQSQSNPHLQFLELIGLHIDRPIAATLLQVFQQREWERVTLVGCTGRDLFAVFMGGLCRVKSLHLTGVVLDDHAFPFSSLSLGLKQFAPQLTSLSVTWSVLGEGVVGALSDAFTHSDSRLQIITLMGCDLHDDHLAELLQGELKGVKILNLDDNHCHAHGSLAIARLLQRSSSTLEELNLSEQSPSSTTDAEEEERHEQKIDILIISQALRCNTTLQTLDLSFNRLDDSDVLALCTALVDNDTLRNLDLRSNWISNVGIVSLSECCLIRMRGIRNLQLARNPFDDTDELLEAVKLNVELEELGLDHHLMNYGEIQFYITLNKGGRRLLKDSGQHVPLGLWPLVLERCHGLKRWSHDVVFHLLQGPVLFERSNLHSTCSHRSCSVCQC
jgi:hypothetical protein